MLHEVKAQGAAEPLGRDEGLDPSEDLRLAGPVLVVNLHGAAGVGGVQVDPPVLRNHVTSPLMALEFAILQIIYCNILQHLVFCILASCTFVDKTKHTWINSDTKYGEFSVILF